MMFVVGRYRAACHTASLLAEPGVTLLYIRLPSTALRHLQVCSPFVCRTFFCQMTPDAACDFINCYRARREGRGQTRPARQENHFIRSLCLLSTCERAAAYHLDLKTALLALIRASSHLATCHSTIARLKSFALPSECVSVWRHRTPGERSTSALILFIL